MRVTRRDFLSVTSVYLLGCTAGEAQLGPGERRAGRRPNVVLILADDLGYADVGFHGRRDILTPHIDSLAKEGVRFTDGYVSAPVCSPTRAGLMTGRYQQRFGWELNPSWPVESPAMSTDEITVAEILGAAGYQTGLVGKWHLGLDPGYHPLDRGFDEYFGLEDFWRTAPGSAYLRGGEYLTEVLNRKAVEFIDSNAQRPFFLFISHMAVHLPWEATPEYLARFPHIEDPKRKTYAAMLSALDDGVGQVRHALRRNEIEENTLVFFLNDNGGWTNHPLRGHKGTMYEGGIRVPFVACWPGTIPAGTVCRTPVMSLDILPTAAAAAGAPLPDSREIDGVDILSLLMGERQTLPRKYLFWRMGGDAACRHGKWKLVLRGAERELYDLNSDVEEKNDLSGSHPRIFEQLDRVHREWEKKMMPRPHSEEKEPTGPRVPVPRE